MKGARIAAALALTSALASTVACTAPREPSAPEPGTTAPAAPSPSALVDDCPVTSPAARRDVPSTVLDGAESTWFGGGPLWVDLGNFTTPASRDDGGLRIKHAWWTGDGSGQPESRQGPPTVSARPIDGGPIVQAMTGGYATTGSEDQTFSWWPVVLVLPSAGCWEITGDWQGHIVVAVVLLAADDTGR